jgi:hypothetical protein
MLVGVAAAISTLVILFTTQALAPRATAKTIPPQSQGLPIGTYLNVDAGFGSAELTLYPDGHYTVGDNGSVSAEGMYRTVGNQISFTEYGPADAACLHLPGQYTWVMQAKWLSLRVVEDACPARAYDWQFGEWRQERP